MSYIDAAKARYKKSFPVWLLDQVHVRNVCNLYNTSIVDDGLDTLAISQAGDSA